MTNRPTILINRPERHRLHNRYKQVISNLGSGLHDDLSAFLTKRQLKILIRRLLIAQAIAAPTVRHFQRELGKATSMPLCNPVIMPIAVDFVNKTPDTIYVMENFKIVNTQSFGGLLNNEWNGFGQNNTAYFVNTTCRHLVYLACPEVQKKLRASAGRIGMVRAIRTYYKFTGLKAGRALARACSLTGELPHAVTKHGENVRCAKASEFENFRLRTNAANVGNLGGRVLELLNPVELKIAKTAEEITKVYKTGPSSCMSIDGGHSGNLRFAEENRDRGAVSFYAYHPWYDGIGYLDRQGQTIARASLLNVHGHKILGRVYSVTQEAREQLIAEANKLGYSGENFNNVRYSTNVADNLKSPDPVAFRVPAFVDRRNYGDSPVMPLPYCDDLIFSFGVYHDAATKDFVFVDNVSNKRDFFKYVKQVVDGEISDKAGGVLPASRRQSTANSIPLSEVQSVKCGSCGTVIKNLASLVQYTAINGVAYCRPSCALRAGQVFLYRRDGGSRLFPADKEDAVLTVEAKMVLDRRQNSSLAVGWENEIARIEAGNSALYIDSLDFTEDEPQWVTTAGMHYIEGSYMNADRTLQDAYKTKYVFIERSFMNTLKADLNNSEIGGPIERKAPAYFPGWDPEYQPTPSTFGLAGLFKITKEKVKGFEYDPTTEELFHFDNEKPDMQQVLRKLVGEPDDEETARRVAALNPEVAQFVSVIGAEE